MSRRVREETKRYRCPVCQKPITSKSALAWHMRLAHGVNDQINNQVSDQVDIQIGKNQIKKEVSEMDRKEMEEVAQKVAKNLLIQENLREKLEKERLQNEKLNKKLQELTEELQKLTKQMQEQAEALKKAKEEKKQIEGEIEKFKSEANKLKDHKKLFEILSSCPECKIPFARNMTKEFLKEKPEEIIDLVCADDSCRKKLIQRFKEEGVIKEEKKDKGVDIFGG